MLCPSKRTLPAITPVCNFFYLQFAMCAFLFCSLSFPSKAGGSLASRPCSSLVLWLQQQVSTPWLSGCLTSWWGFCPECRVFFCLCTLISGWPKTALYFPASFWGNRGFSSLTACGVFASILCVPFPWVTLSGIIIWKGLTWRGLMPFFMERALSLESPGHPEWLLQIMTILML